jgi:hypothetical protein
MDGVVRNIGLANGLPDWGFPHRLVSSSSWVISIYTRISRVAPNGLHALKIS